LEARRLRAAAGKLIRSDHGCALALLIRSTTSSMRLLKPW
jgi:hypothetical protein